MTFNDLINDNDVINWYNDKQCVFFNGGTGTGKTTFINNRIATIFNRVLYICNRSKLKHQQINDISALRQTTDIGYIDIVTYQKIDTDTTTYNTINDNIINNRYDFIVCDECHYWISDAWTTTTTVSYDLIINTYNIPIILMSATSQLILPLINQTRQITEYTIQPNYDYITLYKYNYKADTIKIIRKLLKTNDKIVYFCNNTAYAYEIYNQLVNAHGKDKIKFVKSKADNTTYTNDIDNCIINNKLNCKLLICTSVLDNGINIVDTDYKHMICDMIDAITIQQCIGRKRVINTTDNKTDNTTDKLNLYICNRTKSNSLNNLIQQNKHQLNNANKLNKIRLNYIIKQLKNAQSRGVIYNLDFINKAAIDYFKSDHNDKIELICKLIVVIDEGIISNKDDFIKQLNFRCNGRLIKSISCLNDKLKYYNYQIQTKRQMIQGKKQTIWILKLIN